MSQVFGDPKRLVNDYMAGSHAIGIRLANASANSYARADVHQHSHTSPSSNFHSTNDGHARSYVYTCAHRNPSRDGDAATRCMAGVRRKGCDD